MLPQTQSSQHISIVSDYIRAQDLAIKCELVLDIAGNEFKVSPEGDDAPALLSTAYSVDVYMFLLGYNEALRIAKKKYIQGRLEDGKS